MSAKVWNIFDKCWSRIDEKWRISGKLHEHCLVQPSDLQDDGFREIKLEVMFYSRTRLAAA
jgi:hypothetical protein